MINVDCFLTMNPYKEKKMRIKYFCKDTIFMWNQLKSKNELEKMIEKYTSKVFSRAENDACTLLYT